MSIAPEPRMLSWYLHERMALLHEGPEGHVFEALAHVWQRPRLFHHCHLVLVDHRQGNAEEDLGPLVEETIPDPKHRLQEVDWEKP